MEAKEDRPAYVRFELRPVEDRAATLASENGVPVMRDIEMALVTPPYSKDCVELIAPEWLKQMDVEVSAGRLPAAWRDMYRQQYEAWKKGEEMPVNGTPVKRWPILTPAQVINLTNLGFFTVEDVAGMNDEGMRRYGMGALDLKNKAVAWLKSAKDSGAVTQENAALKAQVAALEEQNELLREQNKALTEAAEKRQRKAA